MCFEPDELQHSTRAINQSNANETWRKQSLQLYINEVAFRGNVKLQDHIKKLQTPIQIFCYFWNDAIIDMIVEETIRAAKNKNIETQFTIDATELRQFIGVLIYMSVYEYPNLESYWGNFGFQAIQKTMTWERFASIKQYICYEDKPERQSKDQSEYDPLFRIRKLVDELNKQFDSIPKTCRLCIRTTHKDGMKMFELCDMHGYAYRFEVCNAVLPGISDLGAKSNVVVQLSQTIPDFVHHILYFDKFHTSVPILRFFSLKWNSKSTTHRKYYLCFFIVYNVNTGFI